jgi:prepilin-type N-terminal cleavage/methylation domain-containing protein
MRRQGLTLIEVLVAIAIFAVVLAVVVPLLGFFRLNSQSTRTLNATTLAQNLVEDMRGFWQNPTYYAKTCYEPTSPLPSQVSLQAYALDSAGTSSPLTLKYACASATADPNYIPLKRIEIVVKDPSDVTKVLARVAVDVSNPTPPPIN